MEEIITSKIDDYINIQSRWLDNPHLNDLNPVSMGWHSRAKGGSFGPGVREVYIFQYVISGKGIFKVNGKTYSLKKGDIFLIKKNEVVFYQADFEEPYTYVYIDFNGNMVETLLEYAGFSKQCYVQSAPELSEIFETVRKNVTNHFEPDIKFCVKLYEIFSVLYVKNHETVQKTSLPENHIRLILNYIHTNYMQQISVNQLSDNIGLDRRYLSRIFKKYMGMSPQNYLINYRMEKAKTLIHTQDISINEVCHSVGYTDVFTFSKMYKKYHGISPSFEKRKIE